MACRRRRRRRRRRGLQTKETTFSKFKICRWGFGGTRSISSFLSFGR